MKKTQYVIIALLTLVTLSSADTRHGLVKKGNQHFAAEEWGDSIAKYKEAILKGELPLLNYNLGNALYKEGSLEGAAEAYVNALNGSDPKLKSQAFHNIGNALFQSGMTEEAVKAYINSLKLDPTAMDTKQNLEFALRQMQQQQQQQDQEQDQDQDQKQDQEQQQQNEQEQQKEDEQEKEQQEQQQDQQQDQQQQQEQQQSPEEQMSEQDAKNILDALQNDEKDVQERVIKQQNAGKKPKEKNW
ncbi:MAG: tetratricopeptide repeat protein [FCB group bacterium]|nr:tetratricopeptide repeat protein [FCB group bacterium]